MTTPNRFAIRDAGECTFFSLVDGHAIVTLPTLKTSGVSTTGNTVYSQGGRGNAKLVGFSSDRAATLKLEDAIFDNNAIAMLTGNDLVSGVKTIDRNEIQSVTSNKLTLSKTPQGAIISVYKVNADGTNGQEYTLGIPSTNATDFSLSGSQLTFNTAVVNGTKFRVYYKVNTASDAKTMKVTSDVFGGSFRVSMEVLVVDEYTKQVFQGILDVPNAKFENNFDMNFAATGDPSVLTLSMEVLKDPTSTDMWSLTIFDEDTIV